jgi:hypothetical protein
MTIPFLTALIRFFYSGLFLLVPLILTPWNYELFEYNKMMATYGLTAIIGALFLIRAAGGKRLAILWTPLDIPLILFLASQLLSALYSIDPHVSWFGYYSRFNGGVWSVIAYLGLYFVFGSIMLTETDKKQPNEEAKRREAIIRGILATIAGAGILVAAYGVLERLGIDKHLWVQDVQNRVFSTLGQPNWLAAYLVALSPLAQSLMLTSLGHDKEKWRLSGSLTGLFWAGTAVLFFTTLLFTRSRSGLLAFAISDLIFFLTIIISASLRRQTARKLATLHLVFAIIVFINGTNIEKIDSWATYRGWANRISSLAPRTKPTPALSQETNPRPQGTLLEYGGTESGTIRKYVWQAAIASWKSSTKTFLIGTGTETFAWTFFKFRPAGHNLVSEWDFLYNKAHNEYLNYLATTGLLGLGAYLLVLVVMAAMLVKTQKRSLSFSEKALGAGMLAGWSSILITNFFGFSVVIMQILLFLLPILAYVLKPVSLKTRFVLKLESSKGTFVIFAACLGGFYLIIRLVSMWRADTLFASGYRQSRNGQYLLAKDLIQKAVNLNPGEPFFRDELANALAPLAVALAESGEASSASELAKQALDLNTQAIITSPANVNFWKSRTKIYYAFSAFNEEFTAEAIKALETARELSPNDPKIIYNIAILQNRQGNLETALNLMLEAKKLKPNYRDAFFGLYALYTEKGDVQSAAAEINSYLTLVDPTDQEFQAIRDGKP